MMSAIASTIDLDGWKARSRELANPDIDQPRYTELITAFASQLHSDINDPKSLSAAALAAPRVGSSTDKHGLNHPARQIAIALFTLSQPALSQSHSDQPEAESEKTLVWARIRYTQTLSSLSARLRQALKDEEAERLARINTTHVHDNKQTYTTLKDRPISRDVIHPTAMPVTQTDISELLPFFNFLKSNTDPFTSVSGVDVRQSMIDACGGAADYTGDAGDQFEFRRGVYYMNGRLDLCKQVVGPAHIEQLMQSLRPNTHVTHFLLGNNVIGRQGADAISAFVRDRRAAATALPGVRTWYLAGCDFDGESMRRLVDEWQYDSAVEAIWLKRNPLSLSGAQQVARLLSSPLCARLRVLDVDNTGLLDEGATAVFDALKHNQSIRHLYISANGIGPVGAKAAADYFEYVRENYPRVKGLRSLFMSVNRIGDEGAVALAGALSHQPHLKRLLLASNRIESAGVIALAGALEHNSVLQVLDFGFYTSTGDLGELPNRMEDAGCAALARMVTRNTSLQYLSMAHNGLTTAAYTPMADAVQQSSTLCYLEMVERGQQRPEAEWSDIQRVVESNAQRLYGLGEKEFGQFALHRLRNIRSCRDIESVYRTRDFTKSKRRDLVKRWPENASSPFL